MAKPKCLWDDNGRIGLYAVVIGKTDEGGVFGLSAALRIAGADIWSASAITLRPLPPPSTGRTHKKAKSAKVTPTNLFMRRIFHLRFDIQPMTVVNLAVLVATTTL
jgi:hypothetical protein